MLSNVRQKIIKPVVGAAVTKGTLIFTGEYNIYARLEEWGYAHKTVNHLSFFEFVYNIRQRGKALLPSLLGLLLSTP